MKFLPIPGFQTLHAEAVSDGPLLYLGSKTDLHAYDLECGSLLWEVPLPKLGSEYYYQIPRRIRGSGRLLVPGREGVFQLIDTKTGVKVLCRDRNDGRILWGREIPTPAPLEWTESRPVTPNASTEEIDASLAEDPKGRAVLVAARTSRRMTHMIPLNQGGAVHLPPPPRAQLDVFALKDGSAADRWSASYPGIELPILEKKRFRFLVERDSEIITIDPESGAVTTVGLTPKPCCWPVRSEGRITAAWRTSKGVGVRSFGDSGGETFCERKGTKAVRLHEAGPSLVMQLNERTFRLLQPDLRLGPEIAIKGHIYGVAAAPDGMTVVATAGAGGGLYILNPADGVLVGEHLLPQGAWNVRVLPEAGVIAATFGEGVAAVDFRTGEVRLIPIEGVKEIAGTLGRRLALIVNAPEPGLQLLDL